MLFSWFFFQRVQESSFAKNPTKSISIAYFRCKFHPITFSEHYTFADMKSIEMISEGFTHKYEFPKNEWYCDKIDPPQLIKEESYAEPSEALRICIDLLVDIYDKEFVKKAFREFDIEDYF